MSTKTKPNQKRAALPNAKHSQQRLARRADSRKIVKLEWWVVEWHSDATGWHEINLRHPTRKRGEAALSRLSRTTAYHDSPLRLVGVEVVETTTVVVTREASSPSRGNIFLARPG